MNAYVSQAGPPELPELEYRLIRALCAAPGARSIEELATTIGRTARGIETTVRRLADNGFAEQQPAWIISRNGRAVLAGQDVQARLTVPQQTVLDELDDVDGARTVDELASIVRAGSEVAAAIRRLSTRHYVRCVPAYLATDRAHHMLSGVVTMRLVQRPSARKRVRRSMAR
ncbi:hypothetical protein [Nocardia blacklockiae]|uniref:hypothetical protein n=1 Tax=Nocardia blacklockiae TaxID=480036 RepID=UPI00189602DF|nr:hypothetical protein [Nocardia blacklockiae]MBF6171062.1 hypothetical protein [Nocardia blacklockiae]